MHTIQNVLLHNNDYGARRSNLLYPPYRLSSHSLRVFYQRSISALIIFILSVCICPSAYSVSDVTTVLADTKKTRPLYQNALQQLQDSEGVIPKTPDVYPVHAVYNREAIIPPMCYTRTERKHNPCYVCHQDALPERENKMNDKDLQEGYSFSDLGMKNHWHNLFEDRSKRVAAISDAEIIMWVNQNNYSELAPKLRAAQFKGYIPDVKNLHLGKAAFDAQGFAKDGSQWVAFNYKPFPSTFWPTNGSTDDVMIRLPEVFRTTKHGSYSRDVYMANLAIVEANIKGLTHISTPAINEKVIAKDLNKDGILSMSHQIMDVTRYVGAASTQFIEKHTYPRNTEFLHTVRYLSIDQNGDVVYSPRMKEVRYMRKWQAYPKFVLAQYYLEEAFAKEAGHLPGYTHLKDYGLDNGMGWSIQGFIENKHGKLRANTFEENLFCMGCHNSIGSTIDKTFSFARKIDGARGWGYIDLKNMPDAPNMGEHLGEIATYLQRTGGGDEFRSNEEMKTRWLHHDGQVNLAVVQSCDVYTLITPSRERALSLNKAYKIIVEDQDFIFGRDPSITPPKNVYQRIDNKNAPTLQPEFQYTWDIRLDWKKEPMQHVKQTVVNHTSTP